MEKTSVTYNYPILIGSIILQNSKIHMFNYLHKIYPRLFGDYKVLYMDTDSIIISSLADPHPNLDRTKIFELQAYISKNIPDIVILNETWLKPTILNSELFSEAYDIFRLDRSPKSHPPDSLDPKKFRRNGGGVLIAVNNNLSLRTKMIPVKYTAELLAVELILPDCTKIIDTTCYRVGTLGVANCN